MNMSLLQVSPGKPLLRIKAAPCLGTSLQEVLLDAQRICLLLHVEVEIKFNDVELVVRPNSNIQKLIDKYHNA